MKQTCLIDRYVDCGYGSLLRPAISGLCLRLWLSFHFMSNEVILIALANFKVLCKLWVPGVCRKEFDQQKGGHSRGLHLACIHDHTFLSEQGCNMQANPALLPAPLVVQQVWFCGTGHETGQTIPSPWTFCLSGQEGCWDRTWEQQWRIWDLPLHSFFHFLSMRSQSRGQRASIWQALSLTVRQTVCSLVNVNGKVDSSWVWCSIQKACCGNARYHAVPDLVWQWTFQDVHDPKNPCLWILTEIRYIHTEVSKQPHLKGLLLTL